MKKLLKLTVFSVAILASANMSAKSNFGGLGKKITSGNKAKSAQPAVNSAVRSTVTEVQNLLLEGDFEAAEALIVTTRAKMKNLNSSGLARMANKAGRAQLKALLSSVEAARSAYVGAREATELVN